jgi:tripeptide aminopeptidase
MVNEARLIELFKNLCLIDAPSLQEKEVVAWTKTYLTNMGLSVSEDNGGEKIGGNANNLVATLKGNIEGAPRIFLSAHFDTVEPTKGLVIEERDGVFYSSSDTILGADDKGGMAPAIEAVQYFIESREPCGDVVLLFSCAEEIGLLGAGAIEFKELNLDFGYVLDTGPPVGTFVNRTATHDKLEVTITGKPAHAGKDPEKGISAIEVAADAIHHMKLGRIGPETTANIGVIAGGLTTNVVCPEVTFKAEARSTSIVELDAQVDHMIVEIEAASTRWGAQAKIEHRRHYVSYDVNPESKVIQVAQSAAQNLGYSGDLRTTLGGSDANIYNAKGLPCIVVATGMEKIHTHDECISRKDLIATTELVIEIIRVAAKS